MPSLQDIEQFKQYLNSLGNEPAILAERGESIQDIQQPEEGLSSDLSDLLGEGAGEEPVEGVEEGVEEGPDEDLDMLPADFLEMPEEEVPGEEPVEQAAEEAGTEEETFDLGGLEEEAGTEEEAFDFGGLEEEAGTEEETFDLGGLEEEAGTEEETFELPDVEAEEEAVPAEFPEEGPPSEEEAVPAEFPEEDFGNLEALEDEGFNLDFEELGEHFGIAGEEVEAEPVVAGEAEAGGVEDLHAGEEDYEIADDEFEAVKQTLNTLPRNLKLAIEELIGEKGLSGDRLRSLVALLISGASAKEIAALVSRITGKKIEIPAGYERKTGEEFEAVRGTFSYAFRQNILPMLRIFIPAVLAALLLIWVGVRFVYKPIKAWTLYKTGYEEIAEERFDSANSYFDHAYSIHQVKKWFYEYAEGFIEEKKYRYAEEKYQQLLDDYPEEREGRLNLARLQGMNLGKYEEAEKQLGILLSEDRYDRGALLLSGDMYMQWAITAPEHYEDARLAYATLISYYGQKDEYLFRMLRYFIRTDNYKEVIRLKNRYEAAEDVDIDPVAYAELGGYLIDKGELADVRSILFRSLEVDETVPEIHYNLARLFRKNENFSEEITALHNAIRYLEEEEARTPDREGMLIDSYTRLGERLYDQEKYLDAETYFLKAREHYEKALRMKLLSPKPEYGRIYARLGDLYYYQDGDLDTARVLYNLAEDNRYSTPDLEFKCGYIQYQKEDFKDALLRFYDAGEGFSTDENLLYATGNALFERGDFFAAQGYYDHLIDILENRKKNISHFLIDERPDHRALVENLMKVYNNQGVTLYNLSLKTGDKTKVGDALYYFTKSIELHDSLTRNPQTLEAAESVNLAFLNSRSILYPVGNYNLQIYRDIPRDMTELFY